MKSAGCADSSPIGRLVEEFLAASFIAHPYHAPRNRLPFRAEAFSATDAATFFQKYYVPSNMVIAVVGRRESRAGDADHGAVFRRLPKREKPEAAV